VLNIFLSAYILSSVPILAPTVQKSRFGQTSREMILEIQDFKLVCSGMSCASEIVVDSTNVERRRAPDRRAHPRGGRRAGDQHPPLSAAQACDQCGATELAFTGMSRGFDIYRCRVCRCRLFRLREV
jgi:hypothetical protein